MLTRELVKPMAAMRTRDSMKMRAFFALLAFVAQGLIMRGSIPLCRASQSLKMRSRSLPSTALPSSSAARGFSYTTGRVR